MARDFNPDPKNYYGILGVPLDADAAAIKAAFRARAKLLHPDTSTVADAEAQFRLLNEAYRILGTPETRRRYHAAVERRANAAAARAQARPQPQAEPHRASAPEPPRAAPPKAQFHACKVCGTLSAQPRFVIFREVGGRPLNAVARTVSGVFCPRCAADTAIRSSLHTWVRGMTAVPRGPLLAFPALIHNLKGGEKPVEANARMLLGQARAFLGRGDVDLARATIAQAIPFAETTAYRHEAETLLASLGGSRGKTLKSRWPTFGRATWMQLAPFGGVLLILVLAMTVSLHRSPPHAAAPQPAPAVTPAAKSLVTLPSGPNTPLPTFTTHREVVILRGGPGRATPILARIPKGTTVTMTAIVQGEDWVRIKLPNGKQGFVELDDLK